MFLDLFCRYNSGCNPTRPVTSYRPHCRRKHEHCRRKHEFSCLCLGSKPLGGAGTPPNFVLSTTVRQLHRSEFYNSGSPPFLLLACWFVRQVMDHWAVGKNSCRGSISLSNCPRTAFRAASRDDNPMRSRARSRTTTESGDSQKLLRTHPPLRRSSACRRANAAAGVRGFGSVIATAYRTGSNRAIKRLIHPSSGAKRCPPLALKMQSGHPLSQIAAIIPK